MKSAEFRMLRFLQATSAHEEWVPHRAILNTEDLLPGDEKALPPLVWRGLVEESGLRASYRLSQEGRKVMRRTSTSHQA